MSPTETEERIQKIFVDFKVTNPTAMAHIRELCEASNRMQNEFFDSIEDKTRRDMMENCYQMFGTAMRITGVNITETLRILQFTIDNFTATAEINKRYGYHIDSKVMDIARGTGRTN